MKSMLDVGRSGFHADHLQALTPAEAARRIVPAVSASCWPQRLHDRRGRLAARLPGLRSLTKRVRNRLQSLSGFRVFQKPFDRLHELGRELDQRQARAERAIRHQLTLARRRVESVASHLASLRPLNILARGYTLTTRSDGSLLTRADQLVPGEEVRTRFASGQAVSRVESVEPETI